MPHAHRGGEEDLIKGWRKSDGPHPQAEYMVAPGAGHALCLDKPDAQHLLLGLFKQEANKEDQDLRLPPK